MDNLSITQGIDEEIRNYDYRVKIDNIKLPIKVGDVVGKIQVYDKNKKVSEENLTVSKSIKPLGFLKLLTNELIDLISGEF